MAAPDAVVRRPARMLRTVRTHCFLGAPHWRFRPICAYRLPPIGPQCAAGPRSPGGTVNKTDLINQLAERLDGDKKNAQVAVEGFIDLIQREVQKGRNVSISGFGVFEKRARAARTARNPRTGEAVKVRKTNVPAFRPGKYFKDVIAGTVKLPKPTNTPLTARAAAAAARASTTARCRRRTTRTRAQPPSRPGRPPAHGPPPSRPRPPAPPRRHRPPPGPGPPRPRPRRHRRPPPGRPGRRRRRRRPRRRPPRPRPPPRPPRAAPPPRRRAASS